MHQLQQGSLCKQQEQASHLEAEVREVIHFRARESSHVPERDLLKDQQQEQQHIYLRITTYPTCIFGRPSRACLKQAAQLHCGATSTRAPTGTSVRAAGAAGAAAPPSPAPPQTAAAAAASLSPKLPRSWALATTYLTICLPPGPRYLMDSCTSCSRDVSTSSRSSSRSSTRSSTRSSIILTCSSSAAGAHSR